jgi:hypothetical protein
MSNNTGFNSGDSSMVTAQNTLMRENVKSSAAEHSMGLVANNGVQYTAENRATKQQRMTHQLQDWNNEEFSTFHITFRN